MKNSIKSLMLIVLTPFLIVACDNKKDSGGGSAGGGATNVPPATSDVIHKLQYYRGGFFAPPNQANWTYDLTIDFTNYNPSGYLITAEHPDDLCFKANDRLTTVEATELITLITELQLLTSTGPKTADAGVEYVELTMADGLKRRYHLLDLEVPAGQYYAINPADLRSYLRAIDNSLPVACQ